MKKILALFILGLLVGCSSTDEGIFTKSGTMYVDYPVTYRQPVAFEDSDVTINGTTIGTGGGSVTGQVYRIYADSQANMFANQPSTYQLTNSTLSTTHIMAGFDKDTKELFGADIVYLPSNFNSNVLISASIHTAGTTNLTAAMYFWYSDGAWLISKHISL